MTFFSFKASRSSDKSPSKKAADAKKKQQKKTRTVSSSVSEVSSGDLKGKKTASKKLPRSRTKSASSDKEPAKAKIPSVSEALLVSGFRVLCFNVA